MIVSSSEIIITNERRIKQMPNANLKKYCRSHDVFLWELAMYLKISEATLTRMLRTELSAEQDSKMRYAIDDISRQKESEV